ncbi:hypothetical protein SCLO_1013840 [Sphingobium cloacae]|uniref:Uncharacterized protein n=2 Tax=Sphingobium cloacae TaxID=120107 RepID=A0A1E1F1N9_9SPHN|nr:hypothetical protein SCLO_1013840 [Sphingobium cloacae]
MHRPLTDMLGDLAIDPANGWSIGSFGAVGEFMRDATESASIARHPGGIEIATARGAIRIAPTADLKPVAWDSLSSDGEGWSHALAFCVRRPESGDRVIAAMGHDDEAIRTDERSHRIFDLGVGCGAIRMALRTDDPVLADTLDNAVGNPFAGNASLFQEVLRAQPHRILLSPAGRIEIFQPVPPPDGKSPEGPHTHLLAPLIGKDRPHSSTTPIPEGWQSALTMHPPSPWRTNLGERMPFDPVIDSAFAPLLECYGLPEDAEIERMLLSALSSGNTPEFADWPETRRGRAKARIVLRRLAAAGDRRVRPWRFLHDHAAVDTEPEDEAAS